MESCEKKLKHLEMIEGIIERMGSNSFHLKGWTVALVTALVALSAQEHRGNTFLLSLVPAIAFWFLDAFYLQTERKYRELYTKVAKKDECEIDFSMDTRNIVDVENDNPAIAYDNCFFSKTEMPFYGVIIATIAGFWFIWG